MRREAIGVIVAAGLGLAVFLSTAVYAQESATAAPGADARGAPSGAEQTPGAGAGAGQAQSTNGEIDWILRTIAQSNAAGCLNATLAPTGDALFDRYAKEVDALISAETAVVYDTLLYAAVVPDATLGAWEGQFSKDPRYWELRYLCARIAPRDPQAVGPAPEPAAFLREAQARGVATANTLLLLYGEVRGAHQRELDAAGAEAGGGPERMRKQEREELVLLDAAVAAGPDEAWPHYMRALYWFDLGEQGKALEDMTAGNAAPENAFPLPWPTAYVSAAPGLAAPPGSAAVCGAIYSAAIVYPLPNFIRFKEHLRETFVCLNLGGSTVDLEAWHQFACRLGESVPAELIYVLVGVVLDGMVRSYVEENYEGGAGDDTLLRCRGAATAIRAMVTSQSDYAMNRVQAGALLVALEGSRGYYVAQYLHLCEQWRLTNAAQGVLADLSQVHYPALDLPACMLKYEPLTQEEAQHRGAERRKQREAQ
jgi:hypothetical protein